MSETPQRRISLTDAEREAWVQRGEPDAIDGESVGIVIPETKELFVPHAGALEGEMSHCGFKQIVMRERRKFTNPKDGSDVEIDCARYAVLDIEDSPVHKHRELLETYRIVDGNGQMAWDDEVFDVWPGDLIVIRPGIAHGIATTEGSVRATLEFDPAIAPAAPEYAQYRDEVVVHKSARSLIPQLRHESREKFMDAGALFERG